MFHLHKLVNLSLKIKQIINFMLDLHCLEFISMMATENK